MTSCEATGPCAIVCLAPSSVVTRCMAEVLNHALRAKEKRADDGDRQQDIDRAPGHVDPEIADRVDLLPGEAAHQRDGDGQSGRRRSEVLHRQRGHLHEVAKG